METLMRQDMFGLIVSDASNPKIGLTHVSEVKKARDTWRRIRTPRSSRCIPVSWSAGLEFGLFGVGGAPGLDIGRHSARRQHIEVLIKQAAVFGIDQTLSRLRSAFQ